MTQFSILRSVLWAPTIAMSWLWGLGFFYAIHVTLTHGWLAFAAFATANITGLFLFGWVLGAPNRDPVAIFRQVQSAYGGIFLLCQIGAVALTIFGFVAYVWQPLFGGDAAIMVGLLVLTQALASIQTHHAAEEAAIETVHVPQLLPAMFGEAEDGVAKIGKLI